jgi:PAS domain-containing protein
MSPDCARNFFSSKDDVGVYQQGHQLHLNFAAFVLGVPIFAVTMEYIGWKKKDPRIDRIAYDFTKLFTLAYTVTAVMGSLFLLGLPLLYPKFIDYMMKILGPTWWLYLIVMYGEVVVCYYYFYSWKKLQERKGFHIALGVLLNILGAMLLLITSAWVGFMTTPAGVNAEGELLSLWGAIHNIGPFSAGEFNERLIMLVIFLGVVAVTALTLGTITTKRKLADADLRRSRDQLEVRIRERTQELAGTHVALQSEVAERKQKERDLHHAREKLRRRAEEISRLASIVEASHDAIMEVSLDGVVRSWNVGAQVMFGYCAEDIIGRPISILIPQDRPAEAKNILEKYGFKFLVSPST